MLQERERDEAETIVDKKGSYHPSGQPSLFSPHTFLTRQILTINVQQGWGGGSEGAFF